MPTPGVNVNNTLLVELRRQMRMSQADVAGQLDLHVNFYQRVEAGKARISLALLSRIESYFGLDPALAELVADDERPQFRRTTHLPSV